MNKSNKSKCGRKQGWRGTHNKYVVKTLLDNITIEIETFRDVKEICERYRLNKSSITQIMKGNIMRVEQKPNGGRSTSRNFIKNHKIERI